MSATLGDNDFYENLLQYMNENTQISFMNQTPLSFSPHEAEKHSLEDENMMEDVDNKRRESSNSQAMDSGSDETDTKPKKKPGRKLMMTEPANKRKAQNRAAQRAFRERKEAHVKGLETRVTELEELTQSKDAENELLKNQIQSLQAELVKLQGGSFNFDFNMKGVQNLNTLTTNTDVRNPFQQSGKPQNAQQSSPSPSSGALTDSSIFLSGQSSLATSPENDVNKNTTPKIDIPFDLFSSNSAGPVNFNNNNSNHTSPLFSTDLFSNSSTPSNSTAPIFGRNLTQNTSPVLDTFASTLTSLTQGQSPLSLANGFNALPSSASSAPLSTFTPTSTWNLFDMSNPLFNTWRDNTKSSGGGGGDGGDDSTFDIFDTMFSSMSPGAFNVVDPTGLTDFIIDSPDSMPQQNQQLTANGEPALTCPELWEKVKNHPKFDDIDIDQLCAEMRSKAKCSNSGPFLSSRDFDETISKFVKS